MFHFELHEARRQNTTVIPFSRKVKLLGFGYKLREYSITCSDYIKDSAVLFDFNLHYQHHVKGKVIPLKSRCDPEGG